MMCEFLGENDIANRIKVAVEKSSDATGSTSEIGDAIIAVLN